MGDISQLKSIDGLLYDLIDEPELIHGLASKLTDILIDKYRQYDELNLWDGDAYYNHSTAALTNDLDRSVSPDMHDEFDITY